MSSIIPPGTALDGPMRERLTALVALLRSAELQIVDSLRAMQNAPESAAYMRARLRETREIIDGLLKVENGAASGAWAEWAMAHIPATYASGAGMAVKDLVLQGMAPVLGDPRIHAAAIDAVLTRYLADATEIVVQVHSNVIRASRLIINQAGFGSEIATGIISGEARRTTSKRLERALRDVIREALPKVEDFDPDRVTEVEIGGRTYRIDAWAEMHARTETARVVTAGTRSMSVANGVEHVQITSHAHEPCICTPYEGRIYRLFEDRGDMRFPWIGTTPNGGIPFHPNCVHREAPAIIDYLEERGDVAGRMAVPADFRGLSERELARVVRANRDRLRHYSRQRSGILPETFQLEAA